MDREKMLAKLWIDVVLTELRKEPPQIASLIATGGEIKTRARMAIETANEIGLAFQKHADHPPGHRERVKEQVSHTA